MVDTRCTNVATVLLLLVAEGCRSAVLSDLTPQVRPTLYQPLDATPKRRLLHTGQAGSSGAKPDLKALRRCVKV